MFSLENNKQQKYYMKSTNLYLLIMCFTAFQLCGTLGKYLVCKNRVLKIDVLKLSEKLKVDFSHRNCLGSRGSF